MSVEATVPGGVEASVWLPAAGTGAVLSVGGGSKPVTRESQGRYLSMLIGGMSLCQ